MSRKRPHVNTVAKPTRKHVVLVGCGNIGSHLVPLVARWKEVGEVTLVDFDVYEPKNVASQSIDARDLGPRSPCKRGACARLIRRSRFSPFARVEDVALGRLRADYLGGRGLALRPTAREPHRLAAVGAVDRRRR